MNDRPVVYCFDIGGTLVDSGKSFVQAIQRLAGRPLQLQEIDSYINLAVGPAEHDLSKLAHALELPSDEVQRIYADCVKRQKKLYSDVFPMLRACGKARCVALSNAAAWLTTTHLFGAERYLERIFYSYELGCAKPDVRAFKKVEEALGVSGSDILMVGDSLSHDFRAARAAGWRAVLLDRDNRYQGSAAIADDDRVTDLLELTKLASIQQKVTQASARTHVLSFNGDTESTDGTLLLPVPPDLLPSEYTARPVRLSSGYGNTRAQIVRGKDGSVLLILGPSQRRELGLVELGTCPKLEVTVVAERLQLTPPPDLEQALLEAGLQWSSVPERDRHLLVGLVKEAQTPELRRLRIQRIITSLQVESI